MKIYPAIDLYDGKAVRLYKGRYEEMTIYHEDPLQVALSFQKAGATCLHLADLEGAKVGGTPNLSVIQKIVSATSLYTEVGGGIRSMKTIDRYLSIGVDRVILGTAAVTDEAFLVEAVSQWNDKIAVGIDLKDGYVAIKGWTEQSAFTCDAFFDKMQRIGVKTIVCTDISKDGAMNGTNLELYRHLSKTYAVDLIASGGVSTIEDVEALRKMDIHGAIIGKAYYTGAIDLSRAIEVAV